MKIHSVPQIELYEKKNMFITLMGRLIDITIKRCETKLTGYFPQPNNWIYNEEEIPRKIGIKSVRVEYILTKTDKYDNEVIYFKWEIKRGVASAAETGS